MVYAYEMYFSPYVATRMDSFTGNMWLLRIHKGMGGLFGLGWVFFGGVGSEGGRIIHLVISLLSQIPHHELHIASIKLTAAKM